MGKETKNSSLLLLLSLQQQQKGVCLPLAAQLHPTTARKRMTGAPGCTGGTGGGGPRAREAQGGGPGWVGIDRKARHIKQAGIQRNEEVAILEETGNMKNYRDSRV